MSKYLFDSVVLSHPIGEFYPLRLEFFKGGKLVKTEVGVRANFEITKEAIAYYALEYGMQGTSPRKKHLLFFVRMEDVGYFEEIPFNEEANRIFERGKRRKELEMMNESQREYEVERARAIEDVSLRGVIFDHLTKEQKQERINAITFETILAKYQ